MTDESRVPALVQKGLTEEEAKLVTKWIEEGKPGLSKMRAERFGEMYIIGYSCGEIHKTFPEYPIEILLWARVQFEWDVARQKYRELIHNETLASAVTTRMEGLRFLSNYLSATHKKWNKQLLEYLNDPVDEKLPEFLPKNIHVYSQALAMLENMVRPKEARSKDSSEMPLVNVNINSGKEEIVVSQATNDDVKKALLDEVKRKRGSK